MRTSSMALLVLLAAACAGPQELVGRSDDHLRQAQAAAARGDLDEAYREQKEAQRLYDLAAARAFQRSEDLPEPPPTPPPLKTETIF